MLASELFKAIEEKVPQDLALENDKIGYLGPGNPHKIVVNQVQVMLDLIPQFDPAKCFDSHINLVICHHPPLFKPRFPVYVIHSNWDIVEGGANDALAECLGLEVLDVFDKKKGIGRICSASSPLEKIIERISSSLPLDHIKIINGHDQRIEKIALVSGFGLNPEYINLAYEKGVDLYLSGDISHQSALIAKKLGICVVDATHHATEIPGLIRLCELISESGVKAEIIDTGVPWKTIKV